MDVFLRIKNTCELLLFSFSEKLSQYLLWYFPVTIVCDVDQGIEPCFSFSGRFGAERCHIQYGGNRREILHQYPGEIFVHGLNFYGHRYPTVRVTDQTRRTVITVPLNKTLKIRRSNMVFDFSCASTAAL